MMGIVVGEVSMFASEIVLGSIMLMMMQAGLYVWERKRKQASDVVDVTRLFSFSLITVLFCLGVSVGIIRAQLVEEKNSFVCESACTFYAKIISSPETKNDNQVFNVHGIESGDEVLDIQIRTPLYPNYEIGETLQLSGKVTVPDVLAPHGDRKSFDYTSYLFTKNVGSEMVYPHIEVVDDEAHTVTDVLGRWKENMIEKINLYISSPASSLASGMLFGNSSMSKELTQTFRVAGLSHIIVLSGFNIAVVITFVLFVLAFLPLLIRILLASCSVLLFVIMVGGEASVVRATLMAFIALLATLIGREYMAKQALIISLLLIVLYEPYSLLHDVSLHLSFLATMGIVYTSDPLLVLFKRYIPQLSSEGFRSMIVTTLSAYLTTLPYIMYTFGAISMYALLANILVLSFVPLAMLISFLVVVLVYIFSPIAVIFGFIDSMIINMMIWVASIIEHFPFSYIMLTISFGTMCILYVIFALTLLYLLWKIKNETIDTYENGILTDIIKY